MGAWETMKKKYTGQHLVKRTIVMLIAVTVMGVGVGCFMLAAMGSDPFSTLNLGVSSKIGLSFGAWQAIFNIILLAVVLAAYVGVVSAWNVFKKRSSIDNSREIS